jgi:hypothetical protein
MKSFLAIPPPIISTQRENGDDLETTLSAIVSLNHGDFIFDCLSRKWDKRYRFEHPDLGLVIFDENGKNLVFTTIVYSKEELQEFKKSITAWQYVEIQSSL